MRILHIIQGTNKEQAGLVYALISLLNMERELGFQSEVLSIDHAAPPRDQVVELATALHLFPATFPARFYQSSGALDWLKAHAQEYDLIQIHSIWNFLTIEGSKIAQKKGVPYVIWPHGALDHFDLQKKSYLKKILGPLFVQKALQGANHLCFTAQREVDESTSYGAETAPVVLPLPIDMPEATEEDQAASLAFRQKWGLTEEDFVLLFLSRIDYKKGLNLLLPALGELAETYPQLKLIMAGGYQTPYMQKVREWISTYKLEDRVVLPGFVSGEEKKWAFQAADAFVLPSLNENFGIAVVESLFYGLPVLITDNVYIHDQIDQQGGWVCPYEVAGVKNAIQRMIEEPDAWQLMRSQAKTVAHKFSMECLQPAFAAFYQSLSPKAKPPTPVSLKS
ncbi:MAG: glycosyltransferase [Bacteroidota bacterium]